MLDDRTIERDVRSSHWRRSARLFMLIPAFGGNTSGPARYAIAVTKPYQASRTSNGIVGHNGIKSSSIGNSRFAKQMSQDGSQNDCKRRIGSLETKTNSRNAGISGLISHYFGSHAERRKAWPGRQVRTVKFRTPALTSDVWLCLRETDSKWLAYQQIGGENCIRRRP